jgi:hypothetical protein
MNDVSQKSIGELIDQLITTSLQCWHAQEILMQQTDDATMAKVARQAQEMNARRNALIRAIDTRLGEADNTQLPKTYA